MKLDKKLQVGLIGLGGRGKSLTETMAQMDQAQIAMVADVYPDRVRDSQDQIEKLSGFRPKGTTDYRQLLAEPSLDCVVIATSWNTHTNVTKDALRSGKYVGLEVGGAYDLEDCWELVRLQEETGTKLMMLENCCYGEREMAVLNMVKKGMLGRIVHCQGGYQHDLRGEITTGRENRHYRFQNFLHRNGELYPTHELGPIANILNLNRGNRMVSLCSMSSSALGLQAWIDERAPSDSDLRSFHFTQGDVTTTMIKCAHGETILLIHDVSLPRPYSRASRIQGTGGIYMEDNNSIFLWDNVKDHCSGDPEEEHNWEPFDPYLEKYGHPLWKQYKASGIKKGHGGIDYLVLSAFFESVERDSEPPIDVYDAASWMAITCLSEQSIAMGSHPVAIPDFTRGRWINERPGPKSIYALDAVYDDLF